MVEVVAPAGNFDKLKTALLYGADAIYLGSKNYNLRAGSENFSFFEIEKAVKYTHQKQKKVYVTLNSYFHDSDYQNFVTYINFLSEIKIDAVICSDIGVISTIKKHSDLRIHLSTQAFVLNSWHSKLWKKYGVQRIVVGRELTVEDIAFIKNESHLEVETFIHGAMCMSYSGHCTISNYTAGRDSNRGGCIQSCRHVYTVKNDMETTQATFMSSKDLCGLSLFKKMYKSGINAFKIEGRMKSELYVAATTRAYSQTLHNLKHDENWDNDFWNKELEKIPHRGYTTGSLQNYADDTSIYNGNKKKPTYQFLGTIIEINNTEIAIHIKNKICCNDTITIFHQTKNYEITIMKMKNSLMEFIAEAPPQSVIWVNAHCPVEKNLVVCKIIQ